jgi:hypothetical protein
MLSRKPASGKQLKPRRPPVKQVSVSLIVPDEYAELVQSLGALQNASARAPLPWAQILALVMALVSGNQAAINAAIQALIQALIPSSK